MYLNKSVKVSLVIFLLFILFNGNKLGNKEILSLRRSKDVSEQSGLEKLLLIMGQGIENAPSFREGIELFRTLERSKLSTDAITEIWSFVVNNLLEENNTEAVNNLFSAASNYALGIRRDEIGDKGKVLRIEEIKKIGSELLQALELYYENGYIERTHYEEIRSKLNIVICMAGLWATSPISSKPMLMALAGGNTAIMAANTQMSVSIPGLMLASMEFGAPLIFESAMSEVNLQDPNDPAKIAIGYIGRSPQEFAEVVRYYAFLLGYDLPYAIHADHTTVSKDTPEAIDYARRLNQAQLSAGYTSFAIDPSSIPAVREETQLKVLNALTLEEFLELGIDENLAKVLAEKEFKKLKEISSIEGMDEEKINALMDYIESKILVEVLNGMTYEDLMKIPRMDERIARVIVQHGPFVSLAELKNIEGLGEDDTIYIEGMDKPVLMFDYLKTYLDLKRIIEINLYLSQFIPPQFGLEVEVGHIGRVDPLTGEAVMTTPLEAVVLIEALHKFGIRPQLLAVNNGTKHGIVFVGGKEVPTSVDVERTREIAQAIRPLGVALAQHGTTGTPFEVIKDRLAGLILKANVGTEWRRTALRSIPLGLFYRMVEWTVEQESKKDPKKFANLPTVRTYSREELLSSQCPYYALIMDPIKRAIGVFRDEIDNISGEDLALVISATHEMARQYFEAFNAIGKVQEIINYLGWGW